MTDRHTLPAGSDVTIGPPNLPPTSPVIGDLREALGPDGWAVIASLSSPEMPPQDVVGLLPPLDARVGPDPAGVAARLADRGPTALLSVARFALPMAAAALEIVPPISGSALERHAATARRNPRAAERLLAEAAARQVLVPVEEDAVAGLTTTDVLGGALQVVTVDDGPLPRLPLIERAGSAAVHIFSGVWPLLHANPPFPVVVKVAAARVAEVLPEGAVLSLDVGCLHETLITAGR